MLVGLSDSDSRVAKGSLPKKVKFYPLGPVPPLDVEEYNVIFRFGVYNAKSLGVSPALTDDADDL